MSKLPGKFMNLEDVADHFGVSKRLIERQIAAGKLAKMKVGNRTVIAVEEVERYTEKNTERAQ